MVGLAGGGVTVDGGVLSPPSGCGGSWAGAAFLARPLGRAAAAISGSFPPSGAGFGTGAVALVGVDFDRPEDGEEESAAEADRPVSVDAWFPGVGGCDRAGGLAE